LPRASVEFAGCLLVAERCVVIGTVLLIILILLLIGALPRWPYNSRWGYYPSGGLGLLVILLIILLLSGGI
jgi:hypothetical protein